MLRTIMLGQYSLVQGRFLRQLDDGRIVVKAGNQVYIGVPVGAIAA